MIPPKSCFHSFHELLSSLLIHNFPNRPLFSSPLFSLSSFHFHLSRSVLSSSSSFVSFCLLPLLSSCLLPLLSSCLLPLPSFFAPPLSPSLFLLALNSIQHLTPVLFTLTVALPPFLPLPLPLPSRCSLPPFLLFPLLPFLPPCLTPPPQALTSIQHFVFPFTHCSPSSFRSLQINSHIDFPLSSSALSTL